MIPPAFVCLVFCAFLIVGPGLHNGTVAGMKDDLISICKNETYVTIDQLREFCGVPGRCGEQSDCEGKVVLLKGYIDYDNVFDRQYYPQLDYEKFSIRNTTGSRSMEVWVESGTQEVFKEIYANRKDGKNLFFVRGVLKGIDLPTMGACHRDLKIIYTKQSTIFLKRE